MTPVSKKNDPLSISHLFLSSAEGENQFSRSAQSVNYNLNWTFNQTGGIPHKKEMTPPPPPSPGKTAESLVCLVNFRTDWPQGILSLTQLSFILQGPTHIIIIGHHKIDWRLLGGSKINRKMCSSFLNVKPLQLMNPYISCAS